MQEDKEMPVKVLTANRLCDGACVWLSAAGRWVHDIDKAFVARHTEAVAGLEEAGRIAFASDGVIDVNVIDVEEIGTHLRPLPT
jgi:hypothetical protein